jgi:cytochrome b
MALQLRVWDPWVRFTHWSLVLLMISAYVTAEFHWFRLHTLTGYAVLTLVIFRIAWGLIGSWNARFTAFLRPLAEARQHLAHLFRREPDTGTTHNATGGWVVVAFLLLLGTQAGLGLFANDDSFQAGPLRFLVSKTTSDWLTGLHSFLFDLLMALIALHVAAVLFYRVVKGQDLVRPMLTGVKTLPEGTPPPRLAHPLLGAVLLAASAAAVYGIVHLA